MWVVGDSQLKLSMEDFWNYALDAHIVGRHCGLMEFIGKVVECCA